MIAAIRTQESQSNTPAWHGAFLAMVPRIRRAARITFRKVPLELRHDLIQEVIANSFVAFARLAERG